MFYRLIEVFVVFVRFDRDRGDMPAEGAGIWESNLLERTRTELLHLHPDRHGALNASCAFPQAEPFSSGMRRQIALQTR